MRPILFNQSATAFNNNGLGCLSDCISCTVTEERNGAYELKMEYPVTGIHYELLKNDMLILAKPNQTSANQAFRIYEISRPIDGIVSINAEHISYQLSHVPISPFTAVSIGSVLSALKSHAAVTNPFTFWTDKTSDASMTVSIPTSCKSLLLGTDGSVLDTFGGEYEWDNFTVKLHAARGADNGVKILYGKNLTDVKQDENISDVVTGVYPYYSNGDNYEELPEQIIQLTSTYSYPRVIPLDLSSNFDDTPSVDDLRAAANNYISQSGISTPTVSIDVDFLNFGDTVDFAEIKDLETVNLCDTVTVIFEKLGVNATAKITKTEYDVLLERYSKISVGDTTSTISDTVAATVTKTSVSPNQVSATVKTATDWITGASGGHMIFKMDDDGNPQELICMDTTDIETAQVCWRFNLNGIGYSTTGYNGDFDSLALTGPDGTIKADRIKSGTITSDNSKTEFNLDSGYIKLQYGTITNARSVEMGQGAFILLANGIGVGSFGVDSYGKSTLEVDKINYKTVSWKSATVNGETINYLGY